MSNQIINSLLKEYEKKRINAELNSEKRKFELYQKIPRLQEIEDELNSSAISTAKNILNNNSYSLKELNEKIKKLKYEKNCILLNNNIDINYLKPKYECSFCNDTGYISDKNYETKMCSCLKQKLLNEAFNKSNMFNLEKENFNTFNENVFSDEVDLSKYRQNMSPRNNIKQIKKKCIEFVDNFNNPEGKNLLFTGNTGLR